MSKTFRAGAAFLISILSVEPARPSDVTSPLWRPELSLIGSVPLQGSFVSPQTVYADSERVFLCSYQGTLFVLERDRRANFPLIQTIAMNSPLTGVRGDEDNVYLTSRDGSLYVFSKTWPLRLVKTVTLSNYGLAALEVVGTNVYVAKGQAAMTASKQRLYLSALNPGDVGVDLTTMRSYGEQFESGTTVVFDRSTLQLVGLIPNTQRASAKVTAWQDFVFLTQPGCCGPGIDIYDGATLKRVQFINRFTTNTVAGIKRKGVPLLIGGTESGTVDLYRQNNNGYEYLSSADLHSLTGFNGPEDIEIRALWADGLDNLVFAASSWGNDSTRGPSLPSLFILEIR